MIIFEKENAHTIRTMMAAIFKYFNKSWLLPLCLIGPFIFLRGASPNSQSSSNSEQFITDMRDSQTYPIVKLENTYWLASNLNFKSEKSDCYEDELIEEGTWGRYYPIDEIHEVCPEGWRLPNYNDWQILKRIIDKEGVSALCNGENWKNNEDASNSSGLSLVPSGFKHKKKFLHQYLNCSIWFNHSDEHGSNWHFHTDGKNNNQTYYFHTHEDEVYVRKFAVRCVCEEDLIEK